MFVCGPTAAWPYGIDVDDPRKDLIWVGCRNGSRRRTRPGCFLRELTVTEDDLRLVNGITMTSPLRTTFDCGRWLGLTEAVVVADALAHERLITADELRNYAASHRGLRGVRQVDLTAGLMDARSESPMETRLRLLLVQSGLPLPEPQFVITSPDQRFFARADLAYPKHRVLVEYDGAWHFRQRRDDDRRRDMMRRLGWEVIVVSAEDYYHHPGAVVDRVRAALVGR